MRGTRAMLLAGAGALAVMISGVPAMAQPVRAAVPVWGDRTGFDDYDWIDRADAISEAIGEAPPDMSFVFEQGEPWAWTLEDGSVLVVEELQDGPHGYYFEAGSDTPFLVRDPAMSFGFIDGAVAVVYGGDGQAMGRDEGRGWLAAAMRGYERGRRLKRALALRDRQRDVSVNAWFDMSYLLFDWQDDWDFGLRRNPLWRRHHDGPRGAEYRRRREHERQRREVLRGVFERWGQGGYHGKAPGRFTPPKPGTQPPPHRWDGRGHDRPGRDRPRGERDPRLEHGPQPDLSVNPVPQSVHDGGEVTPLGAPARPPRTGGGYRPRPEPQVQVPAAAPTPTPPVAAPVEETPPVQTLPRQRPSRDPGWSRPPRSDNGGDTPRPTRIERPVSAVPTPQNPPTPTPAPTRSYSPPPERHYSPPASPAPSRSYTPSPSPAPSHATPTPTPSSSPRSQPQKDY